MTDWKNIDALLKENDRRCKALFAPYDPVTGEGSPIDRFILKVDESNALSLPKTMLREQVIEDVKACGSIARYSKKNEKDNEDVLNGILILRIAYDFEYWAGTCAHIQDKASKQVILFRLRKAQRKLLKVMYNDYFDGVPVRVIVVKARQWGGSTLVQLFMAWVQLFHFERWHSCIVADVEEQARNIRAMYTLMAENHPTAIRSVKFEAFEGSSKNKKIRGRNNIIYIGSMQKPDGLRSSDIMMAHLSEVGLWKETKGKKPADVIQAIAGTVPPNAFTIVVEESTAKGIGNYFHEKTMAAVRKENDYKVVFVGCFENEENFREFDSKEQMMWVIDHLTDKEKTLFDTAEGCTLQGLWWYRFKKSKDDMSDWRMESEFPPTMEMAFQSTGRRAHDPSYIARMRRTCKNPLYKGDIFGASKSGEDALKNITFHETNDGELWIWEKPDTSIAVTDRYVVSVDIGGRSDNADWSVIRVFDRYWLMDGGVEEAIVTWRGHMDHDLMVWKAAQIATWYCNALLVVEVNTLLRDAVKTEGDHAHTVLDTIKDYYDNLYMRAAPADSIREGTPGKYGFFTGSNKTDLVDSMNARFRDMGYIERDERTLNEADSYEFKDDGTYGAVEGMHDDVYMSTAIGLKVSEKMPIPRDITAQLQAQKERQHSRNESDYIRSESDI